jgi:PAS domain-containing protein
LAAEAARESESRFSIIANSSPVLIWMPGPDKLGIFFNKPWLDFTGRALEQAFGNGWADRSIQRIDRDASNPVAIRSKRDSPSRWASGSDGTMASTGGFRVSR